jgi:hypothetical protein
MEEESKKRDPWEKIGILLHSSGALLAAIGMDKKYIKIYDRCYDSLIGLTVKKLVYERKVFWSGVY